MRRLLDVINALRSRAEAAESRAAELEEEIARLREALDANHLHSEWGPFAYMGRSGLRWARIGKAGCPTCSLIGRPEHRHDASCQGTGALG